MTGKPLALSLTLFLAISLTAAVPQKEKTAEALLGAALHQEEVEGNLEAAITTYEKILTKHSANRALAARAQLHIGICYEKLGKEEAKKAYQAVIDRYASQHETVRLARERLAHLSSSGRHLIADKASGMVVRRVWVGPIHRIRDDKGAISPDGRYLTFVKRGRPRDLFVRDLATGENRRLTHAGPGESADESRVSPDGRQIAYQWDNSDGFDELRIIGIEGSGERVLYRNQEVPHIHTRGWLPDGKHILVSTQLQDKTTQIAVVSVADGSLRVLKSLEWTSAYSQLTISPDGRYIAHNFRPKQGSAQQDIALLAVDGSREVPLVEHPADDDVLAWAPDGRTILFRSDRTGANDLWAIAVVNGKPQGPPQLVKKNIGEIQSLGFTREGAFYYGLSNQMEDIYLATLDPASGKVLVPAKPFITRFVGNNLAPDWSPDGKRLAYISQRSVTDRSVIVIRSLETGEERVFSPEFNPGQPGGSPDSLHWSPDGRFLLFRGVQGSDRAILRLNVETGEVTPVVPPTNERSLGPRSAWSPDGNAFYYFAAGRSTRSNLLRRDLETGHETELYGARKLGWFGSMLALSPDGRRLVFPFPEVPRGKIATGLKVISTAGGEARELLRVYGIYWRVLTWTPDGRYVIFGKGKKGQEKVELWRIPVQGGEPEKLELEIDRSTFDLRFHPDGRQVAFSARAQQEMVEIWALEDFLPELWAGR